MPKPSLKSKPRVKQTQKTTKKEKKQVKPKQPPKTKVTLDRTIWVYKKTSENKI
jgi:hypothetical protein